MMINKLILENNIVYDVTKMSFYSASYRKKVFSQNLNSLALTVWKYMLQIGHQIGDK